MSLVTIRVILSLPFSRSQRLSLSLSLSLSLPCVEASARGEALPRTIVDLQHQPALGGHARLSRVDGRTRAARPQDDRRTAAPLGK